MAEELKEQIKKRYGAAAEAARARSGAASAAAPASARATAPPSARAAAPAAQSVCGCGAPSVASACCSVDAEAHSAFAPLDWAVRLYEVGQLDELPEAAKLASLGCGNPTALAELHPGEVVLDLGSGGGVDVLLSARRVGPTGKVYGLDMTDEMLALARENQRRAAVTNVEFLKGEMEHVPLRDASVDVIISNCVINLSLDKDKVFAEAFRVLKPGGRCAVSDVVFHGDVAGVPEALRRDVEAWVGCVAGALDDRDYVARLERAGFVGIEIEAAREVASATDCCGAPTLPEGVSVVSGFVRATKPRA